MAVVSVLGEGAGTVIGVRIRIVVAGCHIGTTGIQTASVILGCVRVVVISLGVRTPTIETGSIVDVGPRGVVVRPRIRATEVFAVAVRQSCRRIEVVRRRVRTAGTGGVFTHHAAIGGVRIVVAGSGKQASGNLIRIAHAITVGVLKADAITIHAGAGGISTGTVVGVGGGIEVARRVIGTAEILATAILHVGHRVKVVGIGIHASEVQTAALGVGHGIVVVGLRIQTADENAGAIIGVGCRVVVVRGYVGASEVNAAALRIGIGIVVVRLGIQTADVGAIAIIRVGTGVVVVRFRIRAAEVLTQAVIDDQSVRIVVVSPDIAAPSAGQVFAGTIVIGGPIVVAGPEVGTAGHFESVTDAVAVHIRQAVAVAIVFGGAMDVDRIDAGTVIGEGGVTVVAGPLIGTAEILATAVVERRLRIVVRGDGVGTAWDDAGIVINGGQRVIIGGRRVRTTSEDAGAIIVRGLRIVVLRTADRTAEQDAGPVFKIGLRIEVLRLWVRAAEQDAGAIVGVGRRVIVERVRVGATREQTGAVILVGGCIEVVRSGVRATGRGAAAIVEFGRGVVVVGGGIRASAGGSRITGEIRRIERDGHPLVIGAIAVDEDLIVQAAGHLPVCGELGQKHLEVVPCDAIGENIGHKPGTPHGVVHDDGASGLEIDDPILVGAERTLHIPLSKGAVRRALDADGHPAVVGKISEKAEQHRVDSARKRGAHGVLVERGGRGNDQRQGLVAIDAGEHVVGVGHRRNHVPGRHARQGT